MVRVNKTQFPAILRKEARRRLWRALRASKSEGELFRQLAIVLTPSELLLLEKRLAIPILLARGMSYREIGRAIDASPTAISFVKHGLTKKPRVPRQYDWASLKPEREPLPLLPPRVGYGRWFKAKRAGRKYY